MKGRNGLGRSGYTHKGLKACLWLGDWLDRRDLKKLDLEPRGTI